MRVAVALVAASVAATAASCHAAPKRVLSVHEMIANLDRLNGQMVRVGGYLPSCGGRDCALYTDEGEFRRTIAWFGALNRDHKQPSSGPPKVPLGIGNEGDIDRKAAGFVGHYVVITGRADNRCRPHGEFVCRDRAPDIHPTAIEAWHSRRALRTAEE